MNGKLFPQDRDRRDVIHGGGKRYTTLEDFVSIEDQGERIHGSVVHKVSSDVSKQTFQEGSPQEEAWSMPSR